MPSETHGTIDYGPEGFIVVCDFDPAIAAEIKALQRRRWQPDTRAWIVEPHGPSLNGLLRLANRQNWEITKSALTRIEAVRAEEADLEYSVDVVHGTYGEPWFVCKLGNDDELLRQVKDIPDAEWEDAWWVPAYREETSAPLLAVVQSDMRIEVSEAAWRLLEEPDLSFAGLEEHGAPFADASVPAAAENISADATDAVTASPDSTQTQRRPRVTVRGKQNASEPPAKKDVV